MARALELIISGLSLGGIYALLAFAMSLTISTTRVLNVAHGVFFVWGGAFFVILSQRLNLHPALSLLILTALFFGFALLFEWGIVRSLLGRSVHLLLTGSIMATFGLGLPLGQPARHPRLRPSDGHGLSPLSPEDVPGQGGARDGPELRRVSRDRAQSVPALEDSVHAGHRCHGHLRRVLRPGGAAESRRRAAADPQGVHGRDPGRRGKSAGHPRGGDRAGPRRGHHKSVPRLRLGAGREPDHPVPGSRAQAHRLLRKGCLLRPTSGRATAATAGVIATLGALPLFLSSTWLLVMFLSFVWLILTANYDVLDGFLGHINLGQGAFFGLGAYVTTMLLNVAAVQSLGGFALVVSAVLAVLAAALFAAAMAFPLFRLKGLYFAIGTLILIFLLQVLALNLGPLTGGSYGLYVPPAFFMSTFVAYYLALGVAIVSVALNFYLSRSTLGLAFRCIKEDEGAAHAIGLNLMKYKSIAIVISSLPSAAAGVLFALNSGFIDPNIALGVERSLLPPLMALMGGTGTVLGPVFGTAIIRIIETVFFHYLRLPVPSMLFFGITLLAVALVIPEGLLKSPRMKRLALFRALES